MSNPEPIDRDYLLRERLARAKLAEEDGLGPDFSIEDMRVRPGV